MSEVAPDRAEPEGGAVPRGELTPEETAAVVVALRALAAAADAAAAAASAPRGRPGWLEAARHEALGRPPVGAPADLRRR